MKAEGLRFYTFASVWAAIAEEWALTTCALAIYEVRYEVTVDLRSFGGAIWRDIKHRGYPIFTNHQVRRVLGGLQDEAPHQWCGGDARYGEWRKLADYCDHDDCRWTRGIVLAKWRQLHPDGPSCLCRPKLDGSTCFHGHVWPHLEMRGYSDTITVPRSALGPEEPAKERPALPSWNFIPMVIR